MWLMSSRSANWLSATQLLDAKRFRSMDWSNRFLPRIEVPTRRCRRPGWSAHSAWHIVGKSLEAWWVGFKAIEIDMLAKLRTVCRARRLTCRWSRGACRLMEPLGSNRLS